MAPATAGSTCWGSTGQPVLAALPGRVSYAGALAGRGVVVVDHGSTRTTYEPVTATVVVGTPVAAGSQVGTLQLTGSHCFPRTWTRGQQGVRAFWQGDVVWAMSFDITGPVSERTGERSTSAGVLAPFATVRRHRPTTGAVTGLGRDGLMVEETDYNRGARGVPASPCAFLA